MNYSAWQVAVTTLMGFNATDPNYISIEPSIIAYAENRISRDLNLLGTIARDSSGALTANSRFFTLPAAAQTFDVVHTVSVVTPAGTTPSTGGIRTPLTPVSKEFIDLCWPNEVASSAASVPSYFAMLTDQTIIVGPSPGDTFGIEVTGYADQSPMSAANPVTYIATNLPDLLVAASMIFAAGYMKNYGSQADDPKMAVSWESQYQTLLAGAQSTESRRKFAGASWTSHQAEPSAVPQRG